MPTLVTFEGRLFLGLILLTALLLARLFFSGLWRRYRFFVLLLAVGLVRSLFLMAVPMSRKRYAEFFIATEVLMWVLYVLVVLEIYALVLEMFPGIQSLGRWITTGTLSAAMVLTVASLYPDMAAKGGGGLLDIFFIAERGVHFGLVLVILLMTGFLLWYPMTLPRNVVFHSMLFAFYFLGKASVFLVKNLSGPALSTGYSSAILVFSGLCLAIWAAVLRPSGEQVATVIGHSWNRSDEQRLVSQLQNINAAMGRIGRD